MKCTKCIERTKNSIQNTEKTSETDPAQKKQHKQLILTDDRNILT